MDKYGYLIGEEILPPDQSRIIEQAKQMKIIEEQEKKWGFKNFKI